jgi:2-polyprenyl-6-methoxyphenol hydroxylase-like FAD-dependent oxidoreductase
VPESADPDAPRLDDCGAAIAVAALVALIYSVIEAPTYGWLATRTLVGLILALALLGAFVVWELRQAHPLLDPRMFRERPLWAGSTSIFVQFFAFYGYTFIGLQYLQIIRGATPLLAAVQVLPLAVALMPASRLAAKLTVRYGPRAVGGTGLGLIDAGLAIIAQVGTHSSYGLMAAGLVVLGLGLGTATTPATTSITESLPRSQQGVGSALNDLSRELGGAIGIAVIGSILTSTYSSHVNLTGRPTAVAAKVKASYAVGSQLGSNISSRADTAFVSAMHIRAAERCSSRRPCGIRRRDPPGASGSPPGIQAIGGNHIALNPASPRTQPEDMTNTSTHIKGNTRSLRVIIVGGGIGGLSAAIALRRKGHEPLVLERAPRLEAAGAGITLFANAMSALTRLGVADVVAAEGSPARRSAILAAEGRELTTLPPDLLEGTVAIHRADLQDALLHARGEIRTGVEVTSVDQSAEGVVVRAADGSEERGDLLVGADGLWSLVRTTVAPATPRYAGYRPWRGVSPVSIDQGRLTESWGVGERFGLVDLGSRTYWFATANIAEGETEDPSGRKAEMLRRFAGWHAPVEAVLEATPDGAILRSDVYFLNPLPRWSRDRLVLLGDAAHATTPGVGQGAAMAIEDAVVMADQLAATDELATALGRYESIRRPRAERVLKLSRRTDSAAQRTSPFGRRVRNLVVRRTPPRLQARQLEPIVHHQLP